MINKLRPSSPAEEELFRDRAQQAAQRKAKAQRSPAADRLSSELIDSLVDYFITHILPYNLAFVHTIIAYNNLH